MYIGDSLWRTWKQKKRDDSDVKEQQLMIYWILIKHLNSSDSFLVSKTVVDFNVVFFPPPPHYRGFNYIISNGIFNIHMCAHQSFWHNYNYTPPVYSVFCIYTLCCANIVLFTVYVRWTNTTIYHRRVINFVINREDFDWIPFEWNYYYYYCLLRVQTTRHDGSFSKKKKKN